METRNIPQIKNSLNIRHYYRKVAGIVRAIFGRRAKAGVCGKNRAAQETCAQRERYLSESMAQVQSMRLLR